MMKREDVFMDNLAFNHYSFVNYFNNDCSPMPRKIVITIHICSHNFYFFFMFYEIKLCFSNWFCTLSFFREVEAGLMEYKPDIIISVHPLMQHIPLWVLKWQGLQKKVIFVTVITDLSTCHPTW